MRAVSIVVFDHYFLDRVDGESREAVSAPIPMVGNTVKLALLVYNMSGVKTPTLAATLEGSVLGQSWETISDGGATLTAWGAVTSSADAVVSHALIRVRVTLDAIDDADAKAWFTVVSPSPSSRNQGGPS